MYKQWKTALFLIKSNTRFFKYNTNSDKLYIVNEEEFNKYVEEARDTKIDSIYQKEMIRQILNLEVQI